MQRGAPHQAAFDEDNMVSIHEDQQSDVEMISVIEHPEQYTEDSSADSAGGDNDHPSNDSEMKSDQEWGSGHHLDPSSDHNSNLGSDSGSGSGSASSSESGSNSSNKKRG